MQIKKIMLAFTLAIGSILTAASRSSYVMIEDDQTALKQLQVNFSKMDKSTVIGVFDTLAHKEYLTSMQWLLDQGVRLEQHNIDWMFRSAGFNNKLSTMQWFLRGGMVPRQGVINITFVSAIYGGYPILEWMLSLPLGKGKPDQNAIKEAYDNAVKRASDMSEYRDDRKDRKAIVTLLEKYVAKQII
ncbi:MAG: hypothetical protein NT128_00195 [Proteobacteria bacterium]|nr:hypothetical protein [Pseudomonadota bacterium]